MIEPDINERMARFAPSQTTIGEMRGPTVAEARRLTEQSIAPADPALDMIRAQRGLPSMQDTMRMRLAGEEPEQLTAAPVEDPALEMIRQARRDRMSATFYGASMVNPDEAGKAQRLADQVGMGSELVRRHMPEFERQAQMADFQRRNLPQKDPVLAQFLADKQFAEIAHDDVGTLEKFAPLMVDAWMLYTTGSTLDMRKGAARAKMMKDESWIGTKAMLGLATPADLEQAERLNRKAQGIGDVGFLGTLAEQIELNLRMAPDVLTAGVAGAAAGTLAGPGIMTAAGFAAGTGAGIIATTAQMESGLAYLQMRRDGVSEEEAVRAAVGVGLVNGVIELVGMKVAAAPFKKVAKRLMAQTTAQAIARPTTRKALATAITEWGKQAGAEGLEEAAQEISLIAGERMAKALDGIDPERALEEEIPRIFESFVTGVQVGAVLGSAGPAVNLAVDLKNVNAAERQQEMFTRLATLSTDNKVRQRNPVFFERFMAAQATDAGIPDMYVNAAEMRNVLAQSGLTKEQVDEILPGVRESLAQASELRDDVVIPTARFASRLAGTPLGDALIPHLRGRPNVASIAEMQRAQQMKPQMVAEIEQAAESIDAVRQTEDQQLRAIETTRLEQLRSAGQNEQVAKAGARVYRSFVQSMAAQLKITPEQFEMTRRLRGIQRGEGAAPAAAPLEQAAATTQFYSALEREIPVIDAKALTASGWGERFKGLISKGAIKADELEWSGLADYLKMQEGKVSKDAVLEFLRGNGVRVERMTLGQDVSRINASSPYAIPEVMRYAQEFQGNAPEAMLLAIENDGDVYRALARRFPQLVEREDWAQVVVDDVFGGGENVQQARYNRPNLVLPGGTNYREVLLTLPLQPSPMQPGRIEALPNGQFRVEYPGTRSAVFATREDAEADLRDMQLAMGDKPKGVFSSKHWEQRNVLVHLRMNDRVDADGKRVLFVEEVQSDWGQEGVKRGFVNQREEDQAKLSELQALQETDPSDATAKQIARLEARLRKNQYDVVLAPYVQATDGWLNLGLKQIMLEAVRGNYDRVAFVTGDQSKERYKLSKQISRVVYKDNFSGGIAPATMQGPPSAGRLFAYDLNGRLVIEESIEDYADIENYIGKEVADKLLQSEPKPGDLGGIQSRDRELSGLDLNVGGEGMVEFYDKIVPIAMNKLLKKYGGGKFGQVAMATERRVTNDEIMAAERRGDFAEAERLTAIMERQELGRGEAPAGEAVIGNQPGFAITPELVKKLESGLPLFQTTERGPRRGWFDPVRLVIALTENSDWSTFWHELNHYFLTTYVAIANDGNAPQSVLNDLDILLRWFNMEGDTPEARLASWNALTPEQQAPHFEALAYNSEIYGFEGKAPSLELRSVFAKIASFIRRVYSDVKTDLNNIYRREFGKDLPIMTGEVREVMDRMLATEEQIKTYQAIQSMVPAFQTQQESKMPDAEWAAYQAMNAEAEEAAVMELQKASLRQMAWLEPARSRIIKEMQAEHKERRAEVRKEAEHEVSRRRVYRAMSYLRRGQLIDAEGVEKETSGAHKLDIDMVRQMYELRQMVEKYREPETVTPDMPEMAQSGMEPTRPDWKKLGKGKYGMLASEGLSPDMVAEMFGYANGDAMIRDLVDAKPVKEAIEDRTSELMQARYGDETTPEARERRIQEALHNEARFRFIAVEYRHMSGATEPVRVMMEAARLAAEDIMARKRIKDIRPSQHEAAEARAARDAMNAQRVGGNPAAAAQAAYTRAKNEVLNAPREDTPAALFAATAAAEIAGEAARAESLQRSADRIAEFTERYGNVEPDLLKIRAKRAQLYQNQLAREALKAKAEVAKALKGFRKFFKADSKIAETRELSLVMAARSILAEHGIGRSDLRPTAYLDKLQAYNPAVYEAIAPIVAKATREAGDYRNMRLEDFRAMAEAVEALWVQAKRERGIQVGEDRVAVEAVVAALDRRLEAIGIPEVVAGERAAPTTADRAKRFLMQLRATSRRVEAWTDAMDGSDPERPYTRYLWRPVKDAVEAFRVARNKYVKKFVELLTALDLPVGTIDAPELNYTFGKGNGGIGKAELLGAMLHTGNQSNYRKLLLGRGWATLDENGNLDDSRWQAFVTRMQQQGTLTKSDYDFLQSSWDLLEDIKPLLQKAHYDLMGFYFKEIEATEVVTPFGTYRGGYVPAATDKFLVADAVTREGMAELESDWRQALPSTGMGMTKQRIETYTRPLVLDVRMVATHMDAALRFAMIQPAVKDALKILNDRGFSSRLERLDPTAKNEMLIPWLHRAARQLVSEPGRFKAVDAFWRGVRTRTGMSIMFANLRNAMQQVTGLFPAALKVKPRYLKSALAAYTTSPRQTANMVAALSPFMAERMRGETFELQETMNDILLNPSKFEQVQKWSTKHGYFMQQAFQNNVDIVAWIGAYNQFLAEDAAWMSEERAQKEAIAAGNAAVRLTQGSVLPEDISAFEAGTPFYRTLTQFSGYFNSLANVNGTEYVKVVRDMGWRGGKGKLLYMYMIGFAAPAIVSDAIVRSLGDGWDDDDEDGYLDVAMDFFFGSQFRAAAAVVPFGSSAFTLVTTAFNNKPYDDRMTSSPSVSAIEASTVGVGKAIVNVVDEDKELTGKNVRDVLTALSLATGIPISAAGRPVGYLVDVQRGKVEPEGPVDLIRGLVTGTATQESKR